MQAYIDNKLVYNVSVTTLNNRKSIISRFAKMVDPEATDFSLFNNTDKVKEILDSYTNIDTKWNMLMQILMAIKKTPEVITQSTLDFYSNIAKELKPLRLAKSMNNVKTPKQTEQLDVTLEQLQKRLRVLLEQHFSKYNLSVHKGTISKKQARDMDKQFPLFARKLQNLLMIALYVFQPALRANYASMRYSPTIKGTDKTDNWMVLSKAIERIYMNNFKNVSKLGKVSIELENEMGMYMQYWKSVLQILSTQKSPTFIIHYLIQNDGTIKHNEDEHVMSIKISKLSNKFFGKNLSINSYRHLWEMSIQNSKEYTKMTAVERKNIHKKLLHSTNIAELYNLQDAK